MTRNISNNARSATFSAQTSEAFIVLLTISHPSFVQPIRVSSDPTQILPIANVMGTISNGVEYVFLPFEIQLPQQDDGSTARATINIDNIDRSMVMAVRNADSALSVNVAIVLSSSPDTVEMSVEDFKIEHVRYDALSITGNLSVEYFDLEPYPSLRFTPSNFPGMF